MKSVYGLLLALLGLFLVWLWASGRAAKAWAAIVGASNANAATQTSQTAVPAAPTPAAQTALLTVPQFIQTATTGPIQSTPTYLGNLATLDLTPPVYVSSS